MSKINNLINKIRPNDINFIQVKDVVDVINGYKTISKKNILKKGLYPVIDQGKNFISGYSDDISLVMSNDSFIIFGDHTREIKFVDFPFIPGDSGVKLLKVKNHIALPKYVYHCLKNLKVTNRGYNRHWTVLGPMVIAIPPIEIQEEIVRILDKFGELEVELERYLEAELEVRKSQYEFWRERLFCDNDVNYLKISDFAKCCAGATPSTTRAEYWDNGTIAWMSSGEVNNIEIYSTEKKITELGYKSSSTKILPVNTVVVALAGQGKTRGLVAITRTEVCTNQSLCGIIPNECVDNEYLFYYLQSKYKDLRRISSGDGARGGLNLKLIGDYEVPVPSLKKQRTVVNVLSNFSKIIDLYTEGLSAEIELRRQQYEYYRNKLLNFEELKYEE